MAGDGPDGSSAEFLAHQLGVADHVRFLGKKSHIRELIPQADVLLLPSQLESFGLVALEAMACGVVPVATNVGGLPELVTHGRNGFLEAVGDVEAHALRVIELLSSSVLRARMGHAARHTAETRFCSTRIIPQYERFYDQVLAGTVSATAGA
jgi:glycosyltransferase involved in cell wall biosynthesis